MLTKLFLMTLVLGLPTIGKTHEAPPRAPLLTRVIASGFVPPEMSYANTCELFVDQVVVTTTIERVTTITKLPLTMKGSLDHAIQTAQAGPIEEHSAPTDGPARFYFASHRLDDGTVEQIDLGGYRSDGVRTVNRAPIADGLRTLIDLHCPYSDVSSR